MGSSGRMTRASSDPGRPPLATASGWRFQSPPRIHLSCPRLRIQAAILASLSAFSCTAELSGSRYRVAKTMGCLPGPPSITAAENRPSRATEAAAPPLMWALARSLAVIIPVPPGAGPLLPVWVAALGCSVHPSLAARDLAERIFCPMILVSWTRIAAAPLPLAAVWMHPQWFCQLEMLALIIRIEGALAARALLCPRVSCLVAAFHARKSSCPPTPLRLFTALAGGPVGLVVVFSSFPRPRAH